MDQLERYSTSAGADPGDGIVVTDNDVNEDLAVVYYQERQSPEASMLYAEELADLFAGALVAKDFGADSIFGMKQVDPMTMAFKQEVATLTDDDGHTIEILSGFGCGNVYIWVVVNKQWLFAADMKPMLHHLAAVGVKAYDAQQVETSE